MLISHNGKDVTPRRVTGCSNVTVNKVWWRDA